MKKYLRELVPADLEKPFFIVLMKCAEDTTAPFAIIANNRFRVKDFWVYGSTFFVVTYETELHNLSSTVWGGFNATSRDYLENLVTMDTLATVAVYYETIDELFEGAEDGSDLCMLLSNMVEQFTMEWEARAMSLQTEAIH